jgi:uncharacterized protein DUF6551
VKDPIRQEVIPTDKLLVDPRVQRSLDVKKAQFMSSRFNPQAMGLVTVSLRSDHMYYLIDGQHRVEAARRANDGHYDVLCQVFEGLTVPEEAEMFLALNATTKPSYVDRFLVRGTAGDEDVLGILASCNDYGFAVRRLPANGNIMAVAVLEKLWKVSKEHNLEPDLVRQTLLVIKNAWGSDREGTIGTLLEGIGALISENRRIIDLDRLATKLAEKMPLSLLTEARTFAAARNMRVPMAIADTVTHMYNKPRLSEDRQLPAWRRAR